MQSLIEVIEKNFLKDDLWLYLLDGLKTTLIVTFFALIIGLAGGLAIALIRKAHDDQATGEKGFKALLLNILNGLVKLYVTIIRGTPTTIQLLIMFNIILVNLSNLRLVAIITFGVNSSAYMSELFRGAFQSVSDGEIEAARSLGLSYSQSLRKITLPQAFHYSLPALGNEVITLLKETSISGFIGLVDLTRGATIIISRTFNAIPPYIAAALIYLLLVLVLEKIFKFLEGRSHYAGA